MRRFLLATILFVLLAALIAVMGGFAWLNRVNWPAAIEAFTSQFAGADWSFPIHAGMAIVTAVAMVFASAGLGLRTLDLTGASRAFPSTIQRLLFGMLTGWVLLALAIFAFGVAGLLSRFWMAGLLIAAGFVGVPGWRSYYRGIAEEAERDPERTELHYSRWVALLVLALYLLTIPYAVTPAVESDELRYHLAAPEAWLAAGQIAYLPNQAFSNFPFLMEMLFMMAMALQGTEAAHLMHLTFLELSGTSIALLCFLLIRLAFGLHDVSDCPVGIGRFTARSFSGIAGAGFAAIPTATILACWAFVDIATVAYLTALVYLGALQLIKPSPVPGWLVGLVAGGAMSTKYLAMPLLVLLAALYLPLLLLSARTAARIRRLPPQRKTDPDSLPTASGFLSPDLRDAFRFAGKAALVAALVVSPWLVRNVINTGNPVYPLGYGVFGGEEWSEAEAEFYALKAGEKGFSLTESRILPSVEAEGPARTALEWLYGRGWASEAITGPTGRVIELALSPITTALFPELFESHYLGPLPLMAFALVLAGFLALPLVRGFSSGRFDRDLRAASPVSGTRRGGLRTQTRLVFIWVFLALVAGWIYWFFTYQSSRMLLPTLALLFALAGWAAALFYSRFALVRVLRQAVIGLGVVIALGILHSLSFTALNVYAAREPHPLPVALGLKPREQYLAQAVNYYHAAKWLSSRIGPGSRALLIGEHRGLYMPEHVLISDWFDDPQPLLLVRSTADNDELFARLLEQDVQYVLINLEELQLYAAAYFRPRFTDDQFARFQSFLRDPRLVEVWKDRSRPIYIYEISFPDAQTTNPGELTSDPAPRSAVPESPPPDAALATSGETESVMPASPTPHAPAR